MLHLVEAARSWWHLDRNRTIEAPSVLLIFQKGENAMQCTMAPMSSRILRPDSTPSEWRSPDAIFVTDFETRPDYTNSHYAALRCTSARASANSHVAALSLPLARHPPARRHCARVRYFLAHRINGASADPDLGGGREHGVNQSPWAGVTQGTIPRSIHPSIHRPWDLPLNLAMASLGK